MSKLNEVHDAVVASYACLNALWPIIKKHGCTEDIQLWRQTIAKLDAIILDPGESSLTPSLPPSGRAGAGG
jgi:hypothetical protein